MNSGILREISMPDLDLGDQPLIVSAWLVRRGADVMEGDRIVEILAGSVIVDLSAPATGRLSETTVGVDERVIVGQLLGRISLADDVA